MKPAPHTRVDGTVTRPVLSLERMLERVHEPLVQPWGFSARQRFIETLKVCPQFRADVRELLEMEGHE